VYLLVLQIKYLMIANLAALLLTPSSSEAAFDPVSNLFDLKLGFKTYKAYLTCKMSTTWCNSQDATR
jgi:hypothetical protein